MRSPATGLTDHERGICFRATVRMFPAASRIARLTGAGNLPRRGAHLGPADLDGPVETVELLRERQQRAVAAAADAPDDVRHRSLDLRIARRRAAEQRRDGGAVGVAAEDANRALVRQLA